MTLIDLIVALVIVGLAFWAVRALAPVLGIPEPFQTVLYVLMVVFAVLWLLGVATGRVPALRVF